jgi:hypothetical protein
LLKAATGYEFNKTPERTNKCEIYIKAKITINISREPSIQATTYLKLIYSDIYGPIAPQTQGGRRYIATFINSAIKWVEISVLKSKDEVFFDF